MNSSSESDLDAGHLGNSKWWIPILLLALATPTGFILFLLLESLLPFPVMASDSPYQYIIYFIIASGWLLTFISPIAVYFERKHFTTTAEWTPSRVYYLMVVPVLLNAILSVIYIYDRHRKTGIP